MNWNAGNKAKKKRKAKNFPTSEIMRGVAWDTIQVFFLFV